MTQQEATELKDKIQEIVSVVTDPVSQMLEIAETLEIYTDKITPPSTTKWEGY